MTDPVLTEAATLEKSARIKVNPPVFIVSAGLILAFALFGALAPDRAGRLFDLVQAFVVDSFGWLYISAVAGFLVFVLYLMISRHGGWPGVSRRFRPQPSRARCPLQW